jgi:hypothetical protein
MSPNEIERLTRLEERVDRLSGGGGIIGFGAAAGLALWTVLVLFAVALVVFPELNPKRCDCCGRDDRSQEPLHPKLPVR